jgi:hypothetical protein
MYISIDLVFIMSVWNILHAGGCHADPQPSKQKLLTEKGGEKGNLEHLSLIVKYAQTKA